jgi:hypothetical protein
MERTYRGRFYAELLHEEFEAALNEKFKMDWNQETPPVDISDVSKYAAVVILYLDESDAALADAVVASHDPSKKSARDKMKEARKNVVATGRAKLLALGLTVEELDALLG